MRGGGTCDCAREMLLCAPPADAMGCGAAAAVRRRRGKGRHALGLGPISDSATACGDSADTT
eukprot:5257855-Prymnesium_polylepis.2